jgi:hypothetical protein
MPRGSKPGERRGGRQRGTPNKSTLLKNAAFKAAATDPNLMPLDFFLTLMRQADLPLELRVTVAHQALPLAHRKPKPGNNTYGRSGTVVNKKIGPRVKVVKVNSDDANANSVTPLDFLLGVMRDANNDPALRVRAAGMVAPYLHPKGEPNEAPSEMTVVDDPYGFGADIGDTLKSIHQDEERLCSVVRAIPTPAQGDRQEVDSQEFDRYMAACEKVKQTPAYLELEKSIAEKQAALKCPPNYKELDSRRDGTRLTELEAEGKTRPLTAAEELEQKHLHARLAGYALTPESAECKRMNLLKALDADLLKPEEKEELEKLEARYPEVPLDLTRIEPHVLLANEAIRRLVLHRPR